MNINVIALFPEILQSSFKGLTGKAFKQNIAKLNLIDLKKFSNNDLVVSTTLHMEEEKEWF